MRNHGYLDWAFVVLFTLAVIYQVLIPPAVGLPDNGDFQRMTQSFGLTPADSGKTDSYHSFTRYYDWNPANRGRPFPSAELLFVGFALLINAVGFKPGLFSILSLGLAHSLAYVGVAAILGYCGWRSRHPMRWVIYAAILLLFTDVAYVAYMNSFYAEPSALIFLCATVAFAVLVLVDRESPRGARIGLLGFLACSLLFLSAKLQNAMLGPLFAVGLYLLCRISPVHTKRPSKLRIWGPAAIIAISLVYYGLFSVFTMGIRDVNVYDSVFYEIIQNSPTPEADLRELGLDASYIKYKGTNAWSPGVTKAIYKPVYERVREKGLILFYARHPDRLAKLLRRASLHAFETRPGYLGNFDQYVAARIAKLDAPQRLLPWESLEAQSTSYFRLPAPYFSHSFALVSDAKRSFLVNRAWPIALFAIINIVAVLVKIIRFDKSRQARMVSGIHAAIIVMALMQFLTCTMGAGELDLVKHLFLFDVLCDISMVFLVAYAAHWVGIKTGLVMPTVSTREDKAVEQV